MEAIAIITFLGGFNKNGKCWEEADGDAKGGPHGERRNRNFAKASHDIFQG